MGYSDSGDNDEIDDDDDVVVVLMQFTLSPRTYVKLSLKTNQASGSGVIGLNVERDKAKEDQATFLL